jgi:hypothetical protein
MKNTIKVYVGYNERNNAHYWRRFEIVDSLPEIGDEIDGWTVEEIYPAHLDCEQGSERVYDFDYYEIKTREVEDEDSDTIYLYYAVEKEEEEDEEYEEEDEEDEDEE